jgi:PAS domain S-box-containing protein
VLNTLSHVTSVISKELEESKERVRHLNKLLSVELSSQAKDLKTQKDLLENVINSTNDMIFYKDNNFNYIGCNKEFERFTKKPDTIICKNDHDLFSAEYAEVSTSMDEKTLKLKSTIVNYQWVEYPDGQKVYLLISRSPLKNKMGEIFGLVGIAKDITKEYRLENEKNSALDSLKAKSEFLANMSHEIRTPLNAILGFIDIVKENEANEENIEHLSIVQESGKNLLGIINDILDFSKIESNNLRLEYVQVNPFEKFEQISDIFLQRAEEKNIILKTVIDTNMPKCIKIDPLRISQVISNLLSNAIKFTPNNGEIIYKIDFLKDVNSIFISVKDTGIGIKEESIKHIFKPFTQADSSTTRYFGGTGLGLTISHKLVALMGGELKLKSEVDKGTELYFTIVLPKCDTCLVPIAKRKIVKFVVNEVSFKGKKILLVEDNIANQMFMKVILKKLQLEFDIASDGLEAIDLFNLNKYDLIFMDENMPNLNGIETTKRILKIEKELNLPHTFIVALTAEALDGSREKFLNSGMDEFLTKPVNKKKIINVLEGFLNVK